MSSCGMEMQHANKTCPRSFRMAWHRADIGARRQRPCGNCVHSFYPHLVQLLDGIITERLLSNRGSTATPRLQYLITDGNILFHEGSVISNLNSSGYASIRISGTSISCAPACPLLLRFTWI